LSFYAKRRTRSYWGRKEESRREGRGEVRKKGTLYVPEAQKNKDLEVSRKRLKGKISGERDNQEEKTQGGIR